MMIGNVYRCDRCGAAFESTVMAPAHTVYRGDLVPFGQDKRLQVGTGSPPANLCDHCADDYLAWWMGTRSDLPAIDAPPVGQVGP